jgi:tRNA-splicing ligase RtcB
MAEFEAPVVCKDFRDVMAAQEGLAEIVVRFDPKIVRMRGNGSRADDE